MSDEPLGATGKFPQGKLNEDDEGELNVAIGNENGLVYINFGKAIAWLALPPEEAIDFAFTIIAHAEMEKHDGQQRPGPSEADDVPSETPPES